MTAIITAGVAVIDFVLKVDELPTVAGKQRARESAIVGGGCAANAAAAISRLGGTAFLAARMGTDMVGDMIIAGLQEEGVDCSLVRRFEDGRSSFSAVAVDATGERLIINYRDEALDFDGAWLAERDLPDFDAALADTRWPQGAAVLMRQARERSVPGVIDAEAPVEEAGEALGLASHIAFSASGLLDFTGEEDRGKALAMAGQSGAWVCVTEGENGVYWLVDGRLEHMPAFRVQAVDTLGAGDVWHGAFTLKLGAGASEREAIRYASAVAALKCTRFGGRAGTPTAAEVDSFLKENAQCS